VRRKNGIRDRPIPVLAHERLRIERVQPGRPSFSRRKRFNQSLVVNQPPLLV
jgi:hypothetical protein